MTDNIEEVGTEAQETGNPVEIGTEYTDTMEYTIPKDADPEKLAERGLSANAKVTVPFTFVQVNSDSDALRILAARKWSLLELVNQKLKGSARSAKYQAELLSVRPITTTRTPEQIQESIVRDFMRSGFSETEARAMVESAMARKNG